MSPDRAFRLRLAPSGDAYGLRSWAGLATRRVSSDALQERLALRLGADRVQLARSGREALRQGLALAAQATGRSEVLIPAYACFSVAAAAVSLGLRVRLVDVDAEGRIDPQSLAETPFDDVAAVVVCNLFGRAEPIDAVRSRAALGGAWVIDDAAQAFGARLDDSAAQAVGARLDDSAAQAVGARLDDSAAQTVGARLDDSAARAVGARGDLGVLSFGRGKPLSGLGGGALVLGPALSPELARAVEALPPVEGAAGRALVKAMVWDLALQPAVFSVLAAVPALGIGETPFEPDFERGAIDAASLVLVDHALDNGDATSDRRIAEAERLAHDLTEQTRLVPVVAKPGERSVFPRLALRAPDEATKSSALAVLSRTGCGASGFYPSALSRLQSLRPHLAADSAMPGAERLAGRILTLPVNGRLRGRRWHAALDQLSGL